MDILWLCNVCPTCLYKMAVFMVLLYTFLQVRLHTIKIERRKKLAIGHCFYTIVAAAYTNEFFNMRVPRRYIVIPDRPCYTISKLSRCYKFMITPPLARPSPDDGFTTH